MKYIPLKGFKNHKIAIVGYAIVDEQDYEKVSMLTWHKDPFRTIIYARCGTKGEFHKKRLHTFILNTPKGMVVDHINGNGLDNRRENLRICRIADNVRHKFFIKSNTGYKGVYKHSDGRKNPYSAYINYNYKRIRLGHYATGKEAALKYNEYAIKLHKNFAVLNTI